MTRFINVRCALVSIIVKLRDKPIFSPSRRKMRTAKAWKVDTQMSRATSSDNNAPIRSRISLAALLVKVIAKIRHGITFKSFTKWAIRCVNTRVFPDPAPAIIKSGPCVVWTASACLSFIPLMSSSTDMCAPKV